MVLAGLLLVFAGTAIGLTVTVGSELEAGNIFGTTKPIVTGQCEVNDIVKEIRTASDLTDSKNKYVVSYTLEYHVNGKRDFVLQQIETADISTKNLEAIIKADCEKLKEKIELEGERVDKVLIRPENEIYNKLYDLATGKWESK